MSSLVDNKYDLRPLWEAILDVYKEFDRICRKHSIDFYAIGGTAIGAIRHNGFIPWDDDLDLAMKVEDFAKFKKIAEKELPPHLKLVTWDNTNGYANLFAKIADTRIDKLRNLREKTGLQLGQGVFIDLFLLTGIPNSFWGKTWLYTRGLILNAKYLFSRQGFKGCSAFSLLKRFLGWMCSGFHRGEMSVQQYMAEQWKIVGKFQVAGHKYCGSYYGITTKMFHFVVPSRCFDKAILVKFEDTSIPLCVGVDTVVRAEYPDYLTLPPPEKRVLLHINQTSAPWLQEH